MNTRALSKAGSLALIALLAAGCGRSAHVYEPGVYKGPEDPLVAMHATPEQKSALQARFTKGQTDR